MDDVRKAYPQSFDLCFLNRKEVLQFTKDELSTLIDDAKWEIQTGAAKRKHPNTLRKELLPIAQAKALYHFLWSIDHITDQMVKCGWKPKDIVTLIRRMEHAGYDPYSTEEDTAGQFIESLTQLGYKKVKTQTGHEFFVYNPKGY
jgi:hypothetical protein